MADPYHDVINRVMPYVTDPEDRASASMVSRSWKMADDMTREHVTVAMCYAATPGRVSRRFPNLKYLKVKGKPRAAMYGKLIPENWGGYATPWVNEIAISKLRSLKSVHFRRMIVSDLDLDVLAKSRLKDLVALKLEWCSGFSTDGLLSITTHYTKLETLSMQRSIFLENDGAWLKELARHNTSLKVLNFYLTKLDQINYHDLEILATNCSSLVSVKMGDFDIRNLVGFFRAATNLEEFFGGSFKVPYDYANMSFPKKLCRLGYMYMGMGMGIYEMPLILPVAAQMRELDLTFSRLNTEQHCALLERCPNLEVLQAMRIRDRELGILAQHCKKMKRLRIVSNEALCKQGFIVTQIGLGYLAQGCKELEYISVYASNINNIPLQTIGNNLKNLRDFRLVWFPYLNRHPVLPLDEGVKSLLIGCKKLERLGLYLFEGGLTDVGMKYIGQYGDNLRWMLLGEVRLSDKGLTELSEGCAKLQRLEMRRCLFSEQAIATAVMNLHSLRYIWEEESGTRDRDLSLMIRSFWNIERMRSRMIPTRNFLVDEEFPCQLLAYYSLEDKRTDYPKTVVHLEA